MRSRRNLIVGLSISAITSIVCCGTGFVVVTLFTLAGMSAFGYNSCDPKTPKNTEELGQFKLPPSVRNLRSSCFGIQGWLGNAQFEMSPSDLDYFVSHLQIKPPLARNGIPADDDLATKASTLTSFLQGSYQTEYKNGKSFSQVVLIDTSSSTQYLVYVDFGGG